MSLEHCFHKCVQDGCREQKRQERDTNLPNAISSDCFARANSHSCKKNAGIGPREKKQHIAMTSWLLPFIRADNNRFILKLYSLYSSLFDSIFLIPDANS